MKFKVTQKHIDEGLKRMCEECPVALCLQAAFPQATYVSAGWTLLAFSPTYTYLNIKAPVVVNQFIRRFDEGLLVEPFEFEIPDEEMRI